MKKNLHKIQCAVSVPIFWLFVSFSLSITPRFSIFHLNRINCNIQFFFSEGLWGNDIVCFVSVVASAAAQVHTHSDNHVPFQQQQNPEEQFFLLFSSPHRR